MLRVDRLVVRGLPPLSFEVPAGECIAVEGPSGAGKTGLLRAIADLEAAEGYVTLDGVEHREMPAADWRRKVRFVAAEPGWWAATARPQLAATSADKLARLLDALGLAPALLDRPILELSTGERQRLAFARALGDDPAVLLLDEPTAALDPAAQGAVEELIRFHLLSGRHAVLVSHDAGQIERLAHQRLILGASRTTQPGGE